MSKKKVLAVYPDAEVMLSGGLTGEVQHQIVTFPEGVATAISHTCTTRQAAWKSAANWIEGKTKCKRKGDKPGRKKIISIQLWQADKDKIERKHGSVQAFVNHYLPEIE